MRLADLLVDLAAVASASRSVAAKHVALRARQVERYGQTSSILRESLGGKPKSQAQTQTQQQNEPSQESVVEKKETTPPTETQYSGSRPSPTENNISTSAGNLQQEVQQPSTPSTTPTPAPTPPAEPTTENKPSPPATPEKKPETREFKPAPWAEGSITLLKQGFVPPRKPPRLLPSIGRKTIDFPFVNVDGGEEVDVSSLFHTAKGSKILEALKEKEVETKEAVEEVVRVTEKKEKRAAEEPVKQPMKKDEDTVKEVIAEPVKEVVAEPVKEVVSKPMQEVVAEPEKEVAVEIEAETKTTPESSTSPPPTQDAISQEPTLTTPQLQTSTTPAYELRESRVPSSRIGRLWNYGGLAAGMLAGAVSESLSRAVGGSSSSSSSVMLSPANMERLVSKLSRMRGAALKLGQMMSFQDAKMLPPPIQEVLQRVQDRADYMPAYQRDKVLRANLGENWRDLFSDFSEKPIAAASIGQVHRATLASTGEPVAVKIQFPGVADSINSDLDNIAVLLTATKLLPKGLYLNKTIDNARLELGWECDYLREAQCADRYRQNLLSDPIFSVPKIYPEASGQHVLTMQWMTGTGVTRIAPSLTQQQKDWIGTQILRLCLREITEFKFMQTDPNWTNFLYNPELNKLELLDFGASREYPDSFIHLYVKLLEASSRNDKQAVKDLSQELGYLTGHESKAMLEAHLTSVMTLAEPFMETAPEVYDFRDQTITERVKAQIGIMIHERLAPPPEETYSLHRKLSGAFLLCARLGSRVRCRELFEEALTKSGFKRD
ncbi:ABC1 family-domain-containing protein [Apiosordaria backusii]|uniref:ABC1 family-domain-containing protein n=1 Tax=Apiosordaria backusii TaxID=314023 RepID=A0AA40BSU9_9PEZI|nr:ABC1 family-domain-containing protein [Apiosordaria backusii]